MSKKEKLLQRLKSKPKDFTYYEAKLILNSLGFVENNKGKTSGSRVTFINEVNAKIDLHKPHPGNILKSYQVNKLINMLKKMEVI